MKLLYIWLAYIIIGTVLLIGKAITCRLLGIYHKHYQIGFSPVIAEFTLFGVKFSAGIIVPLPWLFRTYEIHDNKKQPVTPIWIRREFPAAKRFAAITGSLLFLYLISMLIYAVTFHSSGNTYLSLEEVNKNGIYADSVGIKLGFVSGDKIIKVNGEAPEKFSEIMSVLYSGKPANMTLMRNDSLIELGFDNDFSLVPEALNDNQIIYPVIAAFPLRIDSVVAGSSAFSAGVVSGDRIITLNGDTVRYYRDFVKGVKQNSNDSIILGINRNGRNELTTLPVIVGADGKTGVIIGQTLTYTTEEKSLIHSLSSGNIFIKNYLKQFRRLFTGEIETPSYEGFESIGNLFPQKKEIWKIITTFLLIYVCWSPIPTPVTEGRYLLAILADKIIRLPRNAPAWISWILIISLIVAANFIDIMQLFK